MKMLLPIRPERTGALVISKAKAGLPVRDFFEYTKEIGLFYRDVSEPDASVFHEVELKKGL
jgi:hypothetical protein